MKNLRSTPGVGLLALVLALVAAAPAAAEFGPIQLASKNVPQNADQALAPVLSADGRFIAFQGTLEEGRKGVFRVELQSGVVTRVATTGPNATIPRGSEAGAPSISADGRYVSFTTSAQLNPVDDTQPSSKDVYVADLSSSPPTYELASARDGSSQALGGDAVASPRVALSGNGRRVAFVADRQVYVRDLDAKTTTLVSVERDPLTGAMEPGVPVPGGASMGPTFGGLAGAALSADGTTVAWLGAHLPAQVPLLADERQAIAAADNGKYPYDEPLWRRVPTAAEPAPPTRRIVGGGDPLAPGCPGTAGTLAEPACRGPFPVLTAKSERINGANGWLGISGGIDGTPQLSADGRTVAVIGNPTEATNVFLVDMAPGLSRVQALRQLTSQVAVRPEDEGAVVNENPYVPLNGHIYDLAISPDGRRVALATARQRFPLAPPNLVTPLPAQLGLVELYLVDLETESIRRLTHGFGGETEASLSASPNDTGQNGFGASAPSFGKGGRLIGFASTAVNLVEGDGNDAGDVFTIEEDVASLQPGAVSVSPPPRRIKLKHRRRLALSAFSLPSGKVRVLAVAPASGRLRASAAAALAAGSGSRRLAEARARARANRPAALILALPRRFRHLTHSPEGVYATARVSFHAANGRSLHGKLEVRFHAHPGRGKGG